VGPATEFDDTAQSSAPAGRHPWSASLAALRILVLLSVLLPLAAYVVVGLFRYQQIRSETEQRLERTLRVAQEHALKVLETNEAVIARIQDMAAALDPAALPDSEPALHAQMAAMTRGKPQIQSAWLLGPDGRALASDRIYPVKREIDFTDRSYFRWHRDGKGGIFLSELLFGRATRSDFFDMSRGRYAPDGRFLGLASVSMSPEYFQKVHADLAAEEPGVAFTLLREDGTLYSRWPPVEGGARALAPDGPVMSRIRAGITSGPAHGVSSIDGRDRLLFFRKVGAYPVYVGTGMEVEVIRRRWLREMGVLAAFGLAPMLGLFVAARMALRRTRDAVAATEHLENETVARRRVEEALRQAQKLEALGRLTGGVAHDFNNALMVISNNAMLVKLKHPELALPQLDAINRAVGSATKLTRQLLAFSRRQALVPEYTQLQARLPAVRDLLAPVLGSRIDLAIQVAPGTLPIRVDSAEFELALINLAINARDAMPSGGRFEVRAANATQLPPLLSGPMVVVEAHDTGTGIEPALLEKVFEPFFTTKPVGEGTGLGLSQVYGLCQRAGGTATVESEAGRGTVVRMFFPAAGEGAGPATDAPAALQRHLGRRILMVEDNDEVAAALVQVLEAMACQVTRLDRAGAARDWLAAQPVRPDLVLSDVVMPGEMDGLALARHVRAAHPGLPILLMTGYAEQLEAISALGFEVLPKPCSADMLAEAIVRVAPSAAAASSDPSYRA
jgi:signal transduction histidine kinase/ActR/RegA family two-component response regulator